jgi:hypothetical protein
VLAGSWSISTVFGRELVRFEAVPGRELGQFQLCLAGS